MRTDEQASLDGPIVVDASTVVEYLVDLTLTNHADRVFRWAADGAVELWAPDLVYAECTSAFRKLMHTGAIESDAASRAVGFLVRLPIQTTGTRALLASIWQMQEFLTPYDGAYVALADELDAPFITAERNLAKELRKRGKAARYLGDL